MTIVGKEYEAKGTYAKEHGISKRRAVYSISLATPTPEQLMMVNRLEKGFHGDWGRRNPYHLMRNAQYIGIDLGEEGLYPDGKWRKIESEDILISLGQNGSL